jgi:SAM-dependent methyltransferase
VTAPDSIIHRCVAGELSAPVALMQLLMAHRDPATVEAVVAEAAETLAGIALKRAERLLALIAEDRGRLAELAELIRVGPDHAATLQSTEAALAACRNVFDRLARDHPVAGVALYSLGSAELLARFTGEIVDLLRHWRLLSPVRRVLDLGCGTGRVAAAIAPHVASVLGVDLSPEMIARARSQHHGGTKLRFAVTSGEELADLADDSLDLVLAVDSFPYIVQCGHALLERHIAEAARLLVPGGDLVIFNFSYRGLATDRRDIGALAPRHGFAIERNGASCFTLWDAAAFHLRRPPL